MKKELIEVAIAAKYVLPYYRERVQNTISTEWGYNPYEATLARLEKALEALERAESETSEQ